MANMILPGLHDAKLANPRVYLVTLVQLDAQVLKAPVCPCLSVQLGNGKPAVQVRTLTQAASHNASVRLSVKTPNNARLVPGGKMGGSSYCLFSFVTEGNDH
jgi:hypothetical protein